jgi:hypothetical protein
VSLDRVAARETEKGDALALPFLQKLEIRAMQAGHRLALSIECHDI